MNGRYRYAPTVDGKIAVYIGDRYLTTCNTFSEILNFIMRKEPQSA